MWPAAAERTKWTEAATAASQQARRQPRGKTIAQAGACQTHVAWVLARPKGKGRDDRGTAAVSSRREGHRTCKQVLGARRALWPANHLLDRGLHSLTVCIGSNPCRPQATHVNVGFGNQARGQ